MEAVADSQPVPLVLLIIPHPMDVLDGEHDSREVDRQAYPDYQPKLLTNSLQQIADQNEIKHVNLFEAFRQRDTKQLYFSGGDDHWNEAGQEVTAEVVADYLVSGAFLYE